MNVREFLWVSNPAKAERAEKELKQKGMPVTEEAVKELYIKYGGYILSEEEQNEKVEALLEEKEVEAKPKRKYAK